ncbi:MAG: hypothetical protein K0Q43_2861, partial [Ramlibacter sp.]|nr:hypothetical protein [Ramlibacter sp.]
MKEMKANHEAKAQGKPHSDTLLQERFVDLSLSASVQMPENFGQLDLAYIEAPFFVEARRLIEAIAKVPSLSRSLYAHALANSYIGDLYLFCDPNELSQRLGVPLWQLQPHFELLQNHGLLWVPEYKDDWWKPPGSGL